jgi:hypothetical protein
MGIAGGRMMDRQKEYKKLDKRTTRKAQTYFEGYLTGLLRAIEIVQRRDVHPQTLTWLIRERDRTLKEMEALDE